jgi:hypothetical protein
MHKNVNTNPMAMEKKQPIYGKYYTKFSVEATMSRAQVFCEC